MEKVFLSHQFNGLSTISHSTDRESWERRERERDRAGQGRAIKAEWQSCWNSVQQPKKTKLNIYPNDFDLHTRTFSNACPCVCVCVCVYLIFALIEFRTCALGSLELKVSFALQQQNYLWFFQTPKKLFTRMSSPKSLFCFTNTNTNIHIHTPTPTQIHTNT